MKDNSGDSQLAILTGTIYFNLVATQCLDGDSSESMRLVNSTNKWDWASFPVDKALDIRASPRVRLCERLNFSTPLCKI